MQIDKTNQITVQQEQENNLLEDSKAPRVVTNCSPEFTKARLTMFVINLLLSLVFLILTLLPVAKIGSSSIGNAWSISIQAISDIGNKFIYYNYTSVPSLALLGMLLFLCLKTISLAMPKQNNLAFYMLKESKIKIILRITAIILTYIFANMFFKYCYDSYGLNYTTYFIFFSIFVSSWIGQYIYEQYIIYSFISKNGINIQNVKANSEEEKNIHKRGWYGVIIYLVISFAFVLSPYLSRYTIHQTFGYDLPTAIDRETMSSNILKREDAIYHLGNNIETIITKEEFYSYNYIFFNDFIKKTNEAIEELSAETEYEEIATLLNDIEIAKQMQSSIVYQKYWIVYEEYYQNETLKYYWKRSVNYDAKHSEDQVDTTKWNSVSFPSSIMNTESILLSRDTFYEGFDFSSATIQAYVKYSDGSVRISLITPSNIDYLNTASPGEHFIEWEDDWGNYSSKIIIE